MELLRYYHKILDHAISKKNSKISKKWESLHVW